MHRPNKSRTKRRDTGLGLIERRYGSGVGGHGPMYELVPFVNAGKMRAIAVTSVKRDPVLPDTVSMIEAGFPGFDLGNWVAIVGPAGIPKDVVAKLNGEIVKILREPATRDRIAAQGFNIVTSSSDELAVYIKSEHEKWGKLVKVSGAKVE